MDYSYKIATPEDYPALVKFWCDNSGWDIIDQATWESRFVNTPGGASTISIAIQNDTGDIAFQFIFIPSKISLSDKYVLGYRPMGTIIKESIRNQGIGKLQEILAATYLQGMGYLASQGGSLIIMVPDPRWAVIFKSYPFLKYATFPLFSLKFNVAKTFTLKDDISLENLAFTDTRIDDLWQKARLLYNAMIARDRQSLAWKNSHKSYQLRGISRDGKLVGLFVWIVKQKDKQILICDILSEDGGESLEQTLKAAVITAQEFMATAQGQDTNIEKVAVLTTPLMQPHLENLGFTKDSYTFPLLIHPFDESLSQEETEAEGWYISAND